MSQLQWIMSIALVAYWILAFIFILLDNRRPQSTFAWLFLFLLFPIVGIVIYLLFGRTWKAFSHENEFVRQDIGDELRRAVVSILPEQKAAIEGVTHEGKPIYSRLLQLVHRNSLSVLTVNNNVEILQDASQKYPRLMEDMRQARHHIHLQYFIWQTDPFTEQLKEIMVAKAREGVEVRLLFDALGCFGTLKKEYKKALTDAGVEVKAYSPLLRWHTVGYRNHRKIAVIDGKVAYTGGLNIGEEHSSGGGVFKGWRDTHLRVTGEAARALQVAFAIGWYNATRLKVTDAKYFPPIEEPTKYIPVQMIGSGPDSEWEAIRQLYFFMILSANQHVYMQSPFFILDESLTEALKAVSLAGVDVRVILAERGIENNQIPYWAANTFAQEVVAAGVRVYFYHGLPDKRSYLHSKTLSIDSEACTIGSANMDIRSFSINYELNAVIYDVEKTKELEAAFLADLEYCTEFDVEEYKQRGFVLRLRDSLARLMSPLL